MQEHHRKLRRIQQIKIQSVIRSLAEFAEFLQPNRDSCEVCEVVEELQLLPSSYKDCYEHCPVWKNCKRYIILLSNLREQVEEVQDRLENFSFFWEE